MRARRMSHLVAVSVVMAALLVWGGPPRAASTPAGSGARSSIDLTPQLFEPGVVSTGAHDFVVRFTPRMDEMHVMRSGPDWYTGLLRYRRRASGWGSPELAPVRAPGSLSYPFLAPDGSRIFFDVRLPARPRAGAPRSPDLWSAPRDGDGWGPAAPLGPEVNGPSVEMHASVAANGNLYFASNRSGGLGGFDIYRAVAVRGGYAAAENLGPAVNSADNEYHAFIAPDERYLLFDARRSTGAGGNDIYISVRRADGGWGAAVREPGRNAAVLLQRSQRRRPRRTPIQRRGVRAAHRWAWQRQPGHLLGQRRDRHQTSPGSAAVTVSTCRATDRNSDARARRRRARPSPESLPLWRSAVQE